MAAKRTNRPFADEVPRLLEERVWSIRHLAIEAGVEPGYLWKVIRRTGYKTLRVRCEPTSVYTIEFVEEPVATIAHLTQPLDRALLMDFDQLTTFLDTQLRLGILLAEEDQILNRDGTGVNFTGILNTPGILTLARGSDA